MNLKKSGESPKRRLFLYSWALYDFANTVFSAIVLTFYFPLYLTHLTQKNVSLGLATTLAMILAGLAVPWLGALSDRTGRTKSYLVLTTLLCVSATALLSLFTSASLLIGTFLVACFFFHASLVFYNALLPVVAGEKTQGFASGLGTGLGYLGVLFSIPIAHSVEQVYGIRYVFLTAAFLFLIFALPLFRWVPERKGSGALPPQCQKVPGPFCIYRWGLAPFVRAVLKNRELRFFFLGNFLVMEAMNTVIFWLVIYMKEVFRPSPFHLMAVFLGLNFGSFVSGLIAGPLTDRWGSRKTFSLAVGSLAVTILILSLTNRFEIFQAVGIVGGGFAFAGIWTAGRKRVVELAPAGEVGGYFGLYNLTTKISVFWSLLFSVLADGFGFRAALSSLVIPSALGLFLISRRNASPYPSS